MQTKQEWKIGDCLELLPSIEDKSIDMILTDLPYGTTACKWDTVIPFEPLWKEWYRILRPNGFIVLTASQPFTTNMIQSNIDNFSHQWIWEKEQGSNPLLANVMPMKNFEDVIVFSNEYKNYDYDCKHPLREYFKNVLDFIGLNLKGINNKLGHRKAEHTFYVTPKQAMIGEIGQSVDHCTRSGSTQFGLCTENTYNELINTFEIDKMTGYKDFKTLAIENKTFFDTLDKYPRIYNPQKTKGSKYKSGGGYIEHVDNVVTGGNLSGERFPSSIINFNTNKSKAVHPTQKPVALFEYLIKTYTNEGDTVHDSCLGSGTTLEACLNTNRNCIGFELSDEWEEHYKNRLRLNEHKLDRWQ